MFSVLSSRVLSPRSRIALTAGFVVAAAGAILIGPQLGSVLAESDDHASFWRAERARQAALRQAHAPAPAAAAMRAAKPKKPPRRMTAYAPAPQPPRSATNPFWFFTHPDAPLASASAQMARPQAHAPGAHNKSHQAQGAHQRGRPRIAVSRLVCVRLCDGYFFPAPSGLSVNDAGCAAACPDAPTRLYSMRSDRIMDAVSYRDRAPYAKLPAALRYTHVREQTCSCGAVDPRAAIMADASLRRGDRYMAADGFLIYQGRNRQRISRRDFKPLAQVRGMSRSERNLLLAMERVSVSRPAQQLAAVAPTTSHVALGPPGRPESIALR